MSSRREARERTLQGIYAFELGGGDAEHVLETVIIPHLEENAEAIDFATSLFLRTLDLGKEADVIVSQNTKNWELSRIALIDRLLLRIGITEMLRFEDIPPKVTINELIEIPKKFSTEKSGKFINGILDTALLDFQREGRLKKSGRGLVGMEVIKKRATS